MKMYYAIFLISIFVVSCGQKPNRSNLLPNSSGKASELLITVDKNKWSSNVGDTLKEIFYNEVIALPQAEPIFDVVNIPNSAFSTIFQAHRNMIRIKISPQVEKNSISMRKNVWAKPQIVFQINAKNDSSFFEIIKRNKEKIIDSILIEENKRYVQSYRKFEAPEIKRQLKEKGILMQIPKGYTMDVNKKDFLWLSHETPMISQALVISFTEYTDTAQFQKDYLIKNLDSVLKNNVPGALKNSYMTTEKRAEVYYKKMLLNNVFAVKLRGLWHVEGDFMGGPFEMISIPDVKRNRIINVFAYVYSPKYNKRNYLRQLDAMISTLKIID